MVEVVVSSKRSVVNRMSKQLLPTPESPTNSTCGVRGAEHLAGNIVTPQPWIARHAAPPCILRKAVPGAQRATPIIP